MIRKPDFGGPHIDTSIAAGWTDVLSLALQLTANKKEREWGAQQAVLDREFKVEAMELGQAVNQYNVLQERLFTLEDSMRGYNLPYGGDSDKNVTNGGSQLIGGQLDDYHAASGQTLDKISQVSQALTEISMAGDFAANQADLHGQIIKAGEDEAWKDYLLEGDITMGEAGELVGTSEMSGYLEKLRTGTSGQKEQYEKLKSANYRRAFLGGLRTIEEAKNLQAIDVQLEQANEAIKASKLGISKNEFEYSVSQLNESERQIYDIYKQTALSTKANFRYISDGVPYSITDLFSVAATDIDDFMDIKRDFLDNNVNYAIASEADAFISGIQQAAAGGMDDSEYVVRFQKGAYDNYVQLQNMRATLTKEASRENKSLQAFMESLPSGDATKVTYKRLNDKHTGYQSLGLFRTGFEMLDRSAQIVNMHNEQQALRLSLDASTAGHIAEYGLGLKEPEEYSPTGDMTPKMKQDLEVSLATVAALTPGAIGDAGIFDEGGISEPTPYGWQARAELDVFESIPGEEPMDYWRGPIDVAGEFLERGMESPDIIRPSYVDPNAPASLSSQLGASLDKLQGGVNTEADSFSLDTESPESYLAGVFVNSNFLRSTGIPFDNIIAQWEAAGRPDPGEWLLELFSDEDNPHLGIEEELIR